MALALLIVNILTLAVVVAVVLIVRAKLTRTISVLRLYFSGNDDKPSEFAATVAKVSEILASSIVASFKGSFMGVQSVAARREKKESELAVQDALGSVNPLLGAIAKKFPAVAQLALDNPQLVGAVMSKLAPRMSNTASNDGDSPPAAAADVINTF